MARFTLESGRWYAAEFLIRPYHPADRESLIDLDGLCLEDLSVPGLPGNFADLSNIEATYLHNGAFLVAEAAGAIVGMGGIRYLDQETARIKRMRVHPAHRRQGIARALLHALEGLAGDAGRSRVLLNTLATQLGAQGLYESQGYRKFGEGEPDGFSVFMYRKDLRATPQR